MDVGDQVTTEAGLRGQVLKAPRSVGRKRPRVLVKTANGEVWIPLDELTRVETDPEGSG